MARAARRAACRCRRFARAQALGVVAFATVGEVTGSLVWGVYHYRLHNLPLFIPPAHGLVYLSGIALVGVVRARLLVGVAAAGAVALGARRADRAAAARRRRRARRAAALRLPLALAVARDVRGRVPRRRARSSCTGRRSARGAGRCRCRVSGTADGNPPSGVASGYVWFDVMALLVAPWLVYAAGTVKPKRLSRSGALRSSIRRIEPIGTISASRRVVALVDDVDRHHPEARLRVDAVEHEARAVGELDLDDRLLRRRSLSAKRAIVRCSRSTNASCGPSTTGVQSSGTNGAYRATVPRVPGSRHSANRATPGASARRRRLPGGCAARPGRLSDGCRSAAPDVRAAELRDHAAARGALDEAELEQVRLVDVLDRVRLLAERDGERREPDRAAVELLDDRAQEVAVDPLEPELVDLEQLERLARDRRS